jgi:glucose-1-phosphate thymidylyltransferase
MKAIILAAGYATRLYPLTLNMSKALLLIDNNSIIDYIIKEILSIECIDCIYVVTNNKFANDFEIWRKNNWEEKTNKIKILNDGTNNEDDRLGAVDDISFVVNSQKINDDALIIAGDSFFDFKLKNFYNFFCDVNCDCACAKRITDKIDLSRFAIASIDSQKKLIGLEEKPKEPKSNIVVYASYIYKKNTLNLLKEYLSNKENNHDAPGYFLQWLYKKTDVYIYEIDGEFFDVGTYESYNQAKNIFKSKKI